jgi:hypothetical protein
MNARCDDDLLGPLGPTLAELRLMDALEGEPCPSCAMAVCTADRWCPVCSTPREPAG